MQLNMTPTMQPGRTARLIATMDVIKSGAHMTKNRHLYSLSNAKAVKQADMVQNNIDPVVAEEMERENSRLLDNANVLVLSKFNEWRYVNQAQYDERLMEVGKRLNAGRELSEQKKLKYMGGQRTFNFDDSQLKNIKTILNNRVDTDGLENGQNKLSSKFRDSRKTSKLERAGGVNELAPQVQTGGSSSRNFH
mmetsp:Transcript_1341/g.1830  ORF Transcript_1341/g.1830 Transcript_1341/m.1830 type:complete len:193 (+) Transcript_1341:52-630(+)